MERLGHLWVWLGAAEIIHADIGQSEPKLFKPLQKVKKPRDFKLFVSRQGREGSVQAEDAPFRLRRPGYNMPIKKRKSEALGCCHQEPMNQVIKYPGRIKVLLSALYSKR